jgi:hypothetical protein
MIEPAPPPARSAGAGGRRAFLRRNRQARPRRSIAQSAPPQSLGRHGTLDCGLAACVPAPFFIALDFLISAPMAYIYESETCMSAGLPLGRPPGLCPVSSPLPSQLRRLAHGQLRPHGHALGRPRRRARRQQQRRRRARRRRRAGDGAGSRGAGGGRCVRPVRRDGGDGGRQHDLRLGRAQVWGWTRSGLLRPGAGAADGWAREGARGRGSRGAVRPRGCAACGMDFWERLGLVQASHPPLRSFLTFCMPTRCVSLDSSTSPYILRATQTEPPAAGSCSSGWPTSRRPSPASPSRRSRGPTWRRRRGCWRARWMVT